MDLSTTYMGLKLASPLVPSASPLCSDLTNIRRMAEAGASAVVLHSLFEEQIRHDSEELDFYLGYGADRFAESLSYYPRTGDYTLGPDEYLEYVAKAKRAVNIPIIASLNGISAGGWISYAKKMQDAGADALELNIYYLPADGRLTAQQVEAAYLTVLQAVKMSVTIPVAIKLSPYFSSISNMIVQLADAGADGLVLFNRFLQPDLDVESLEVQTTHALSTSADNRLGIRWVAIMHGRVRASLAVTNGIHTGEDAVKAIMAGADAVMMTSALLKNGIGHLATVRREIEEYMKRKDYESVAQMKGILSQRKVAQPSAFERANYVKTLQSFGVTATRE
jgi:dihydroorotate dehydrogenase (fumarate)